MSDQYYLLMSAGLKVAVVDKDTKDFWWWDSLPAQSRDETNGLPQYDINQGAWLN